VEESGSMNQKNQLVARW